MRASYVPLPEPPTAQQLAARIALALSLLGHRPPSAQLSADLSDVLRGKTVADFVELTRG